MPTKKDQEVDMDALMLESVVLYLKQGACAAVVCGIDAKRFLALAEIAFIKMVGIGGGPSMLDDKDLQ